VNDLEVELTEERTRVQLAEQRVAILKKNSSEKNEIQRQKLVGQRSFEKTSEMEQQLEMYKKDVSNLFLFIFKFKRISPSCTLKRQLLTRKMYKLHPQVKYVLL
jgi:hypothetical protein